MNNFTLMILSAGFGTRMQNLTRNIPKPLLKINNTTLIKNTINFFEKIGCNRFIINTHYLYKQFNDYIDLNFSEKKIISIYEPEILDTGGGIKNAIKFFDDKNFLVTNCDIFWNDNNLIDVKSFIHNLEETQTCDLLLSSKKNTIGINKKQGDFSLRDHYLTRWKENDEIIFYSGLQKLNPLIFNNFKESKFSINKVWDYLIDKQKLSGVIMESKLFHIGDINTYINISDDYLLD